MRCSLGKARLRRTECLITADLTETRHSADRERFGANHGPSKPYRTQVPVNAKTDEQLLAEHLRGVPGAFDELVDRYFREVYGFLCRFVGNPTSAEDITQDAFVQVHLAADSFDASRSFRPWLYTIAANKARDHLRSRGRRKEHSLDATVGDEDGPQLLDRLEGADDAASSEIDGDERAQRVRELVEQMPDHLRLVLVLGYFQQMPYAEIADVLDIPLGTVKSRLHAAVQHFGKLWQAHDASSPTPERT